MFAGLARSLISDLHLERPAWHPKAGPTIELGMGPALEEKHNRSTETKRILLACFTLSTMYYPRYALQSPVQLTFLA